MLETIQIIKDKNIMPTFCLWNKCNNNCLMCTNPVGFRNEKISKNYTFEKLLRRITNQVSNQYQDIVLNGGEPTIHPQFLKLLNEIRFRFPLNKIIIVTNGRRFYYPFFTKACLALNNIRFVITLHGYNAQTHDRVTQTKGSFVQTVKGIENILKFKNPTHSLELRIVLSKLTLPYLEKILAFIENKFPQADRVVLIFMKIQGHAIKNLEDVGITYRKVKAIFPKMAKWLLKFKEFCFYHFPLCTIPPKFWPYTWRTLPTYELTFLPTCQKCLYKKYCLGIPKEYLKKVGASEFKPIKKKYIIEENNYFRHPISTLSNSIYK